MRLTGNTILITGGSSGIGLGLASELIQRGNTVIVTGRDQAALDAARAKTPGLNVFGSDASDPQAIRELYEKVTVQFPHLNILINNAGIMRRIDLNAPVPRLEELTREIEVDLNGVIWMTSQFLPHLKEMKNAAIVNVSSGLAYVPLPISPIYCAAKAGVHAYTRSLRVQLKRTNVEVFELAPPGVDTPLLRRDFSTDDIGGVKPMPVETLVAYAISGIERGTPEIAPGSSSSLRLMNRIAPHFIFNILSRSVDRMLDTANKPETKA